MIDPLILARSVHLAATVLAAGTVCFMVLVAEPAARTMTAPRPADLPGFCERLIIVVFIALALAIVSGGFWLVLIAADIYGVPIIEACLHGGVMSVITDIRFGQVAIARLALALLIAALLPWPATRLAQLAAAIGLIALPALTGHAGATPGLTGRIHLVSDMVHLLAAGAWLGGLPALAMLLAQARRSGQPVWRAFASAATARFSMIGIVSVGALLATGLVNGWNLLAGPRDLVATEYGRLVLLKIVLFAAMVAIAAVNRYHLSPQLPAPPAMRALGRNSLAETGLGVCVLAFAAALGTMVPAGHVHAPPTDIPPDATFVHIHTNEAMADVTIAPARPGPVHVSIRLTREDSSVFAAAEVLVVLTARAQPGVPPLSRAATRLSDGTWLADRLEIGQSGIWIVKLIVTPDNGEAIVLDAPIVIDP